MSLMMYPGLTQGAIAAILVHGSEEQKRAYLPKMVDGTWTGTMNLTEPHCGTDLGLLRTKAAPNGDGSYSISGQKIFISAGEHDMAENVVHLVLARIEGAPDGVKGISLFIVPKFRLDASGEPGERNGVSCGAIEHKMGIHGNATCVMNYDEATGYLIGTENKGLSAMFVMMNEARLAVGMQGLSIAEVAYQNAASYARERIQGRSLSGPKAPDKKADPIIVHPDIRRTLMTIRAFNEGGRAFTLWTALKSDIAHRSDSEEERRRRTTSQPDDADPQGRADGQGLRSCGDGAAGLRRPRLYRRARYEPVCARRPHRHDLRGCQRHPGARPCRPQARDERGRAVMALFKEIGDFCEENRGDEKLSGYTKALKKGLNDLQAATMWFMQNAMAKPDNAGAGSTDYMHLFGLVVLGYMWARMAKTAEEKLAAGETQRADYLKNKLITARFFMERILPETELRKIRIETGADTMMALDAAAF